MSSYRIATAAAAAFLVLLVPAFALPQKKGATYTGVTSQGHQCYFNGQDGYVCGAVINVSDNGKKADALITWRAPCTGGNGDVVYRSNTRFSDLKINDKAKYHKSATYTETLSDGAVAVNSVKTHGKFKRKNGKRKLVGDFSVESDLTGADGTPFHCESDLVTFTAKP